MFRKIFVFALIATAAGYCFATETSLPQVVTSEVFYADNVNTLENQETTDVYVAPTVIPAWPIAGTDADVEVTCDSGECSSRAEDKFQIVSKIGNDLVVENNINMGTHSDFNDWSGGANMMHGTQIPVGFDDECENSAEMPLLRREVLEDDGGNVLAVSRSGRKKCGRYTDGYNAFAANGAVMLDANGKLVNTIGQNVDENGDIVDEKSDIVVDVSADEEAPINLNNQVRSWVVANGQTLRQVLKNWCDKEGWDLVWTTPYEYPIEASAVFKGRFTDVASAVVRNFSRANPIPYARFYKGNRVLVISTTEE